MEDAARVAHVQDWLDLDPVSKTAGKLLISLSLFVEGENKRLVQLRKDVETVQAALIAREAALADEKLELQKLKDELVAGGSRERHGSGIWL